MSRLRAQSWLGLANLLLYGLLAMATHAHAAEGDYRLGTQGEVLDDRVMYTIGGGSAVG
ncbi:MAG: integrating conjugative element protein, partial [Pseudomonas sp.]|nr:integrating conjugative element protein [Pseudomonas sp.]